MSIKNPGRMASYQGFLCIDLLALGEARVYQCSLQEIANLQSDCPTLKICTAYLVRSSFSPGEVFPQLIRECSTIVIGNKDQSYLLLAKIRTILANALLVSFYKKLTPGLHNCKTFCR